MLLFGFQYLLRGIFNLQTKLLMWLQRLFGYCPQLIDSGIIFRMQLHGVLTMALDSGFRTLLFEQSSSFGVPWRKAPKLGS